MPYRLLHLSDLHLERSFAGSGCHGEVARRRRQGLREALRRAGRDAQAAGCDLVTIGGDLYEHERSDLETGRFLAETFASWAPMRVALAPGNHDPLLPASLYATTDWPANVHLFAQQHLEPIELTPELTLWGLAHQEPVWMGDPLDDGAGAGARREGTHLALFHGAEMGSRPDGKGVHGPFRAEKIREAGFAAALCGHYHGRRIHADSGLVYPGTPEPLTFDEPGRRGPVIVTVSDSGHIEHSPLDTNEWTALTVPCDLTGVSSLTSAVDRASAALLATAAGHHPERTIARVDLTGELPPSVALDVFSAENALRETSGLAMVRVRERCQPGIDPAATALDPSGRGAFTRAALQALEEARDAEERGVLEEALRYGLQALSGVEVGLR